MLIESKVNKKAEDLIKKFTEENPSYDQCFRCGACSSICPVKRMKPEFDPRRIVHTFLLGFTEKVLNEILWYCSQCGSCVEVCPMDVKPKEVIRILRTYALEKGLVSVDKLFELGKFARVNKDKCIVCLTCVRICPFGAPFIKDKEYAEIDIEMCRACGICVKECPARAIELKPSVEYKEETING